jgi:hypothetical protein
MPDVKLEVSDVALGGGATKIGKNKESYIDFVKELPRLLILAFLTLPPDEATKLKQRIEKCFPTDLLEKLKAIKENNGTNFI